MNIKPKPTIDSSYDINKNRAEVYDYGDSILKMDIDLNTKISILSLYYIKVMTYNHKQFSILCHAIGDETIFKKIHSSSQLVKEVYNLYVSKKYELLGKLFSEIVVELCLEIYLKMQTPDSTQQQ
ncbi:hypothetical protein [Solidesulfovibrio magneticus]|uniref:Uncharacterized protein n=1 Tax=Solidesulfovibrio magneticus (strain ATCC 700980 / DSM 13731 / RS-1) TaxID=573370 RepID=C4XKZ2_SOLM1|nr:hypothetical protein [Solidesulfovibrio magneticus]BAH74531.1 hypothetical protein DMR_10400 [Solidesulfovibrio magneticus RS-1]